MSGATTKTVKDVSVYCAGCGARMPLQAGIRTAVRCGGTHKINVEVSVFWCAACEVADVVHATDDPELIEATT